MAASVIEVSSPLKVDVSREHLVEQAAERPDVGALIDGFASGLLGTHVRRRAEHHSGLRHRWRRERGGPRSCEIARVERFRQAEVQDLDRAIGPDLDVGGL